MMSEQEKIDCKQNRLNMIKDIRTLAVAKRKKFDIKMARRMCSTQAINTALSIEDKENDLNYNKYRDKLLVVWLDAL